MGIPMADIGRSACGIAEYMSDRKRFCRKIQRLLRNPTAATMGSRDLHLACRLLLLSCMKRLMRSLGSVPMMMFMLTGNCGRGSDGTGQAASAVEAVDSADVVQNEGAVFVAGTDSLTLQMTGEQAAVSAAGSAKTFGQPSGCVTASASGATVTYTFNDCTGPFGLVHVTGTVVVEYSLAAGGILAHATANDLLVNGASMDIDAQALYSVSGTTRRLAVTTAGAGTGPRGSAITRSGNYVLTWDAATSCLGLDGNWSTTIGGYQWWTQVSGFDKCGSQCPAAGGSISHHGGLSGITVQVELDGSAIASWSASNGRSGKIGLFCQP